jgi:alkanesulfonate monooxygenase SsuD/methylene tetrahydromethanopterin reductase-like flavin-dependent oxidoreductase (luciferase family)
MGPLAVSPFEMHPLKIANSLLSLNEMCGGRAVIAVGAGEGNVDAMNLPKPPKIVRAVRESIEIVRGAALATSPRATRARTSRSICPAPIRGRNRNRRRSMARRTANR